MAGSLMVRCYSGSMQRRHCLPDVWIISDRRNDIILEEALRKLPRGSGLVFRHYHLDPKKRRARFDALTGIALARGHGVVLAGSAREAARWRADGAYCDPAKVGAASGGRISLRGQGPMTRLMTAHSMREIGKANRARALAILLSPVFPTRSHPGAKTLGPVRFRLLARHARVPVIALGGMNRSRARTLRWKKWAAIDGI
jgi:thiamine-phosphate pyrophosphorylase